MGSQREHADGDELVNTSILIPRGTRRAIRFLAAHNERSMGAEIREALQRHIDEAERAEAAA